MVHYDPENWEHLRHRQQYAIILKIRTCEERRCRVMLLRNQDVANMGIANGAPLRILPKRAWSGAEKSSQRGHETGDGVWEERTVDLMEEEDF